MKKMVPESTVDSGHTQSNNVIKIETPFGTNEKIIDSIHVNLDDDRSDEKIVITEGYYEMDNYKFEVYKNKKLIGTIYSQKKYPWLDSLEKEANSCGILWISHYLNGSDCGGNVYSGYVIVDNKLKHIISIPDSYYGCYSIDAPKGDSFYWGNINLSRIKYNCKESIEVSVDLDLNKATSWETMDSTKQNMYDKKHKLTYSWIPEQEMYLVKSRLKKDTAYFIETVYDMTEYLEKENGLSWP